MPHTVPDDLAVRKVRESNDRTFVLRVLSAAKSRLTELDKKEEVPRGQPVALGVDVAANPGRDLGE